MTDRPSKPPGPDEAAPLILSDAMTMDERRAALVEAQIERAIQPYLALLPEEGIAAMRDVLRDALTTHPVATQLVDHLSARAAVTTSATIARDGTEEDDDAGERSGGAA